MVYKKPKPPVPTKPKPTPKKKKPTAQVPVTSVTPRSTVKKPSAKQVAGTRKVVGAIAAVTPVGAARRGAATVARKVYQNRREFQGAKEVAKKKRLSGAGAPKQPNYPSGLVNVKNKPSKNIGLETRGKRRSSSEVRTNAEVYRWNKLEDTTAYGQPTMKSFKAGSKNNKSIKKATKAANPQRIKITGDTVYLRKAEEGLAKLYKVDKGSPQMRKVLKAANKRGLKAANKKK
jgi:hypothetical protein